MVLPTGLIPVLAFVLTVGISVPVTLTAALLYDSGVRPFHRGLQVAIFEAGLLYLVGVGVVWTIAGSGLNLELWEIPATLIVTGVAALLVLTLLPMAIGQRLIEHLRDVDTESAVRFTTYGWPITMIVVFGIFITPRTHLFALDGPQICLGGFCGISVWLGLAVLLEIVVAGFGPGLVGLLISTHR